MTPSLIFIIGPQAVGKMTVGQELARVTGYKFMHNHQTIEPLLSVFDFDSPSFKRLIFDFRTAIFEEVAASTLPGFIFSCVNDFSSVLDRAQTECSIAPFTRRSGRVLFVELEASWETRRLRNRTEHRQLHKPSKRDLDFSESLLMREKLSPIVECEYPFVYPHLKINNEHLTPVQVVEQICAHFGLGAQENAR